MVVLPVPSLANQMNSSPRKMIIPFLSSRRKQRRNLLSYRINSGQVWTFVEIAINASESEIVEFIRAAVHFGNDVFYVQ
jgi:hypothetical protein